MKIFISYSHADRGIAEQLANALNALGQEVFWDRWDIQPGDSLIQKIYSEGLGQAKGFVVLLSPDSVSSKWVKEELDVATLRRIEGVTRVIPALIGDVQPPVALRHLLYVDLRQDFDQGVRRIIDAVEGVSRRPERGGAPEYLKNLPDSVGGLSPLATRVAAHLLEGIDPEDYRRESIAAPELAEQLGLNPEQTNDAADELEAQGLVKLRKYKGTAPFEFGHLEPTYLLFEHFAEFLPYSPDMDVRTVVVAVAASGEVGGDQLQEATGLSPARLNRAVDHVRDYGYADVIDFLGTSPYTFGLLSPTRMTRQLAAEFK